MPPIPGDEALDYLLAASGLMLNAEQKADLRTTLEALEAMKARVRQPRGRMAELAHGFGFSEEDL